MMFSEFKALMEERAGWSFPEEIYIEVIEPVYNLVNGSKADFVNYCVAYDLNGLQRLYHNLRYVEQCAAAGLTIEQTHLMVKLFVAQNDELKRAYAQIGALRTECNRFNEVIKQINTLAEL